MRALARRSPSAALRWLAVMTSAMALITSCTAEPVGGGPSSTSTPAATTPSSVGPTSASSASPTPVGAALPTMPDTPLVPRSDLPDDFPSIPVPAGGQPGGPSSFDGETVGYEYPPGTLPELVSFYTAWFASVGIDPGPTLGSSPSRYWDVTVEGTRVRFEIYPTASGDKDRLAIVYYP